MQIGSRKRGWVHRLSHPRAHLVHEVAYVIAANAVARHDFQDDRVAQELFESRFVLIGHVSLRIFSGGQAIAGNDDRGMAIT
jgi:hypothetical protein